MLISILRIALFVVAVTLVATGAAWLLDHLGAVVITLGGTEIALTPLGVILLTIGALLGAWLLLWLLGLGRALWRFVTGDETALSRYFQRGRERRGFAALADAMVALAAGEPREALSKAEKAERLLGRPELTRLITAQAAEAAGDRKRAAEAWKALLADPRTRFVGVRGLMREKLAEGDVETALALARKAFELRPRHGETLDTLLALQNRAHDWHGARTTLAAQLRAGRLPRDVHARRDAVLALAEALDRASRGDQEGADRAVREAQRMAPDLVPAAVMAARAELRAGNRRAAERILRRAWKAAGPHPELAAAWAALEPDETPEARRRRFARLLAEHPDDPETRMLEAELALAAEDFPAARRALGDLPETRPTARVLTLMAAIAKGQGAPEHEIRGWLARAISAPRDRAWVCEACGHVHAHWVPLCERCGAFDTLAWTEPAEGEAGARTTPELLPVIAGLLEAGERPAAEEAEEPEDAEAAEAEAASAAGEAPQEPAASGSDSAPAEPEPAAPGSAPPRRASAEDAEEVYGDVVVLPPSEEPGRS